MIEKIISQINEITVSRSEEGIITGCNMGVCEDDDCLKCLKKKIIKIVQEVAKEYDAGNNDLTVVSALPSLYPLQPFEEEAIHKVVASAKDGGWIPCSETLPEDNGLEHYEITFLSGINKTPIRSVAIFSKGRWYMPGTNCRDCDWFPFEVIAWKEPSAPYQKGE